MTDSKECHNQGAVQFLLPEREAPDNIHECLKIIHRLHG